VRIDINEIDRDVEDFVALGFMASSCLRLEIGNRTRNRRAVAENMRA
jgi:hypothetical protein